MHADDPFTLTPQAVLCALIQKHVGAEDGCTATQLAREVTGRTVAADLRRLRTVIEALRTAGHRICADPVRGYYLAATDTELDRSCSFLLGRAMTSLRQISAMKRVALPDLRGQLGLPLETNR